MTSSTAILDAHPGPEFARECETPVERSARRPRRVVAGRDEPHGSAFRGTGGGEGMGAAAMLDERPDVHAAAVSFRVLGPVAAWREDHAVRLRGPRHREVLARLIVARGRVVPVDRLIDDLWPDQPPQQALAAVQTFVSQLRRALEPDRAPRTPARVLVTEAPGYALRVEPDQVDAWRLDRLVREVGDLLAAGRSEAALRRAEAALELCAGPAFAEFVDAPWLRAEADRIDELALLALERRAQAALQLGRAADLVADLESHVAAHPLREEAWRLLALAHYGSGRQGDALATLRRARHELREQLGVDPGPALRGLERDVLDQSVPVAAPAGLPAPVAAPAGPAPAAVDGPVASPRGAPLFGRSAELGALRAVAGAAAGGRGGLAIVSGPAGGGKSALVRHLAGELVAQGWLTATGWCPPDGGAPAGWPWAEVLDTLATVEAPAPELAALISRMRGVDPGPVDGDPAVARFRLQRAVGSYLAQLARSRPVLVVLDDIQDADDQTLALLTRLAPDLAESAVLVVATMRDREDAAWPPRLVAALAELARHLPARVSLGGLDAVAVGELVRSVCTAPVDDETAAELARRTGGNPFFVTECARLLEAEGPAAATTAVPAGVRDVLARRIARLPAAGRTLLGHAAVIGRRVDVDVLAEIDGSDPDTVLDAVEPAVLAGLVVEPGAGRLEFAHALVHDVVYEGLSRLRRARLHARVARILERRRPTEVAALAHHFAAAGGADPAAASRYSRLAAQDAEARLAHREAATLWRQSLDATDRVPTDPCDRLDMVLRLVRALALGGDLVAARAERAGAVGAAMAIGDPVRTARAIVAFDVPTLWTARRYGTVAGDVVALAERTLRALPAGHDELRARLLVTIALELEGDPGARGREAAFEAEALARRLDERAGGGEVLVMALNGVCMQHFVIDGLAERTRAADGMLELALRHELPAAEAIARLMLAGTHVKRGDVTAADVLVEPVAEIARRYDRPLLLALVGFYRGMRHAVADRLDEAEVAYRDAVARLGRGGLWNGDRDMAAYTAFSLRLAGGRHDEAVRVWSAHRAAGGLVLPELYAAALAGAGRLDEARSTAGPAGPVRRDYFYDMVMGARARLGIALRDTARVQQAHAALAPYPDLVVGGGTGAVAVCPVAQVLGEIAEHRGRPGEAAELYRRAGAVAERAGAPRWAAEARSSLDRVRRVR